MSAKNVLLYSFTLLCLIVVLALWLINAGQLTDVRAELAFTQSELAVTRSGLAVTQANLATAQTKLSQTESSLADTQNELAATSEQLQETDFQLAQVRSDYTNTLTTLNLEKEQSLELQTTFANLQANYDSLTDGYGYVLRDPTYREVKAFLAADKTDARTYVDDSYVCEDFSLDVKIHAMQQKIRCAFVSIRFVGDNAGHAIVAFDTTDMGIIYIEPQSDEEVNLQVGKHYWTQCLITNVYYTTTYDDTIERFNVIW